MRRTVASTLGALLALFLLAGLLPAQQKKAAQTPPMKLKVGDTAPDFTLRDQNGKDVSLHDFRGKKSVALAFYVFAFSGG